MGDTGHLLSHAWPSVWKGDHLHEATSSPNSRQIRKPRQHLDFLVVAGIGFEPTTFGLS